MGQLADGFHQRGLATTVLTAQCDKRWPKRCVLRDVPVVRLPLTRRRGWGRIRYLRTLSTWLREHRNEFDLLLVSELKEDAYVVCGMAPKLKAPVILRAEASGRSGDCSWQQRVRFGRHVQQRCATAQAVIATSRQTSAELLNHGYAADRVHVIANGTPLAGRTDSHKRDVARSMLVDAHPVFGVPPQAPLVVFAGRFDEASGVARLVEAWRSVALRWPKARLWLVGDGPLGPKIWSRIKDLELAAQIILPGWFDDMEGVLQAANLFVHPGRSGVTASLLEAMASGVPVIASHTPEVRELIENNKHALLVTSDDASVLSSAIQRLLADNELANALSAAAWQRVQQFSLENMIRGHLNLFERCLANQ